MATETPLGTRLRRERERRHWTQQYVADALEVDVKTVRNWEKGAVRDIRNRTGAIEDLYGIRIDDDQEPELVDDELRALIYKKFGREDGITAIGAIEQTLRPPPPVTSPGEERAEGQAPWPA